MNYGCRMVNFVGKVDRSVYQWAKQATKEAIEEEYYNANYMKKALKQEDIDALKQKTADMLQLLEQKAKVMHPDTVITVDQPLKAYRDRFLCVHNKKLDHDLRQTPYSKTNNDYWGRLDRWKVAGRDADKGADKQYGGYQGPGGKDALGLLECRINDIDETRTDKLLFNQAVEYALKCSKSGSSRSLKKQVDNIVSVQKDLGFKSDFVESIDTNRKIADEKRALYKQNEEMLKKQNRPSGFFGMIAGLFG